MSDKPLVSCVMPTANRPEMLQRAISLFQSQDYENRELVILDTSEALPSTVWGMSHTRAQWIYQMAAAGPALGELRNRVNSLARGSLIMHWDDDDWYRADRISLQVDALGDEDICGLSRHLFYKPETDETWLYTYPEFQRPWLAGGTCLYRRELWERFPFPDVQVGSDTQWMWGWPECDYAQTNWPPAVRMNAIFDYGWYVATIHENNTSKKVIQPAEWKPWQGDIHALMEGKAKAQIV